MAKSLGIFVCSDLHLEKILALCEAAARKQVAVTIFLTHRGALLIRDPRFATLEGLASIAVCNVSFEGHGLKGQVSGLGNDAYATQARHAEMIQDCERYVVF